jgi:hypothetical protein
MLRVNAILIRGAALLLIVAGVAACQVPGAATGGVGGATASFPPVLTPNEAAPFAVRVTATGAPPIAVGASVGFRISTAASGYASLYLINTSGRVLMLAENLVVTAGRDALYPLPADGIALQVTPPAGRDLVVLLVTREPFLGYADQPEYTHTRPTGLPIPAEVFIGYLNELTAVLPPTSWSITEYWVEIVDAA